MQKFERSRLELTALQEQAQARMHEIQVDTKAIWNRRSQLVDDIRAMANGLVELANAAAARVSPEDGVEAGAQTLEPESGDETEPAGVSTREPMRAEPRSELERDGDEAPDEASEPPASGPAA